MKYEHPWGVFKSEVVANAASHESHSLSFILRWTLLMWLFNRYLVPNNLAQLAHLKSFILRWIIFTWLNSVLLFKNLTAHSSHPWLFTKVCFLCMWSTRLTDKAVLYGHCISNLFTRTMCHIHVERQTELKGQLFETDSSFLWFDFVVDWLHVWDKIWSSGVKLAALHTLIPFSFVWATVMWISRLFLPAARRSTCGYFLLKPTSFERLIEIW